MLRNRTAFTLQAAGLSFLVAACGGQSGDDASGAETGAPDVAQQQCVPVEWPEANAPDQQPAFEGQTRTCGVRSGVAFEVQVLATGLEHPWAVEPLPDGNLLVTERPGRLRVISATGSMGEPITGLPEVDARNQGGLLDVALSPSFESDRTIFWSYAQPRPDGNGTAVARGVLADDNRSVRDVQVIFEAMPTYDGTLHYGSRLAFAPDGTLYISTGDRSDAPMRHHAQELDNHLGKVLRINADGSVPQDNPFVDSAGARPEIFSYGHRNIQAMTVDADGRLWEIEHGTRGGDEVNLVRAGGNYGWPIQAYGIEYRGDPIEGASPQPGGFTQPVYYWDPVIAPSGAQWYTGDAFPRWQGSLFIGGLASTRLVRLEIEGERVTGEEHLLMDREQRIRDVRQGPDGALYIVTDEDDGELWKVVPQG